MKLSCDICGRPDARAIILIEGAKMVACGGCMRNGKVLHRLDDNINEEINLGSMPARKGAMEDSEELVENYATVVKKAREKEKISIAVIAEKISEKESYLDAIENGRMKPTLQVARKLEKELGIKLIEKVAQETIASSDRPSTKFNAPTLGDMLVPSKKKGK